MLMNENWAAENLHVIRTLMERSALYRRALGPILFFLGFVGLAAGLLGGVAGISSALAFVTYWGVVAVLSLSGCFLLARKQAMKDAEPFWSPPTRHVSQALLAPLCAGAFISALVLATSEAKLQAFAVTLLPGAWMLFYGCALTSAGFFMRRGMRVLGWVFLGAGAASLAFVVFRDGTVEPLNGHYLMGGTFGLLHLACAIYLRLSKESAEAL
jgi:hypothetical protein